MVRIVAENVQRLLKNRLKGVVKVHVINYDIISIDIINGSYVYHSIIKGVSELLLLNGMCSDTLADEISKEYRNKINSIFFK